MSTVAFWHPVGPHGGESFDDIIRRKRTEIDAHGYTLWSFAAGGTGRVEAWRRELRGRSLVSCSVVCCGATTKDPHLGSAETVPWMTESSADARTWVPIPGRITNYHRPARRNGIVCSGFVVEAIEAPRSMCVARPTRWLRMQANEGRWESSRLPTRGEYLTETPEETAKGPAVRLKLTVRDPFVVWLR